jgi:hypothetical protein
MTQLDLFNKGCAAIQKKITEIFKPAHLTIIARSTKFIQRATNCLQAIDFLMLMTACSMQNVTTSLERLCFELRKLNPNANITKQSMMEKINQPEATHFLKSVFEVIVQQKIEAITQDISPEIFSQFGRVLIEDCTECSLNEELLISDNYFSLRRQLVFFPERRSTFPSTTIIIPFAAERQISRGHLTQKEYIIFLFYFKTYFRI